MRGLIGDEASRAAAFDHRIENGERFTRMCRQRQLLGLAYLTEALTENENRLVFGYGARRLVAMADFNDRTNSAATCPTMAGSCWWDAMRFTMALPTITPSAVFDTRAASSGVATPNATATGTAETFLSLSILCCISSALRHRKLWPSVSIDLREY